jgi:Protein of unknown function (DUF2442)
MSSSAVEIGDCRAQQVKVSDESLSVDLTDGRTITVPLAWYPRLLHGTREERSRWQLIGGGEGIHWPDLDEDLSVEGFLLGKPSGESQASFNRWLESRKRRPKTRRSSPAPVVDVEPAPRRFRL